MPKIVVCGKGGSGKSVLTTLLAKVSADKGYQVLIVDADESNLGLSRMLGIPMPEKSLLDYLGGKKEVGGKLRAALSQQQKEVEFSLLSSTESIDPDCISSDGKNISMVVVGKVHHVKEGCACPMGVVAREFFSKIPGEKQLVLVDTEAGIEHLGRGIDAAADMVLLSIEPSFESVLLAEKVFAMTSEANIPCQAVISKANPNVVPSMQVELKKRGIMPIGVIPFDQAVAEACLNGTPVEGDTAIEAVKDIQAYLEREIW
ncbi:cobyrinic acid ac-diamide synthase [Desulfofarcimen acetoxidans DSM 771]|uniref:Cobyrinic acid ac-diamide synthase n=1 Tax=Desulfofarcimen acetoxidans (strain ATCC 49208 / DSM 771 / KCTC 5769 / VKM B-1644 / 5575) TaxID=485916 RepID=C8W441_DESAS|nr:P-loop NTPase [Desulfofarcimen acetoxidans]ACV61295.1 cobyrinic acid ac-diamide synthase [Desulfofarcimen acetoxidans DSM 771]